MATFDAILAEAGSQFGLTSGKASSLLSGLVSLINDTPGGLGGFLDRLRKAGLGDFVSSWVGGSRPLPISGTALEAPNSKITSVKTLHNTPSGDCDIVSFELSGQPFMAISAGPLFKFNPSISFHLKCNAKDQVDTIFENLSQGGKVLMPIGSYPWSERYGWLEDKYGLSWQVIFVGDREMTQRITPVLMFVGKVRGKTEEAVNFYADVFKNAPSGSGVKGETGANILSRYGKGEEPDREGTVRYASFTFLGQEFGAMDSAREHKFAFDEAISFVILCDTQGEIDYFWERFSANPKAGQCGWLKDKYGLS